MWLYSFFISSDGRPLRDLPTRVEATVDNSAYTCFKNLSIKMHSVDGQWWPTIISHWKSCCFCLLIHSFPYISTLFLFWEHLKMLSLQDEVEMFISFDGGRVVLTTSGLTVCCFWPVIHAGHPLKETQSLNTFLQFISFHETARHRILTFQGSQSF